MAARIQAEQIRQHLTSVARDELASAIRALTDQLVTMLVPLLEAEENVMSGILGADVSGALTNAGNRVRAAVERLSIVADNSDAGHRPGADARIAARVLKDLTSALDSLEARQQTAFTMLDQTLTAVERAELNEVLRATSLAAREHTILVGQRAIPPTSSTVLRRRPDLGAPYTASLAEIERTAEQGK